MALGKCKACGTGYLRGSGDGGHCPACQTGTSSISNDTKQCDACGRAFTPRNQRQRLCQRKACKPVYVSRGIPRARAPVTAARSLNAAIGYLMGLGYPVWQSVGSASSLVIASEDGTLKLVEVQTAQEYSNGEVKFGTPKNPDADIRVFVALDDGDTGTRVWLLPTS